MARIRVQLPDGRTGSIEDYQFNPQTMKSLDASTTQTPTETTPQKKSFLGNLGRDVGENVQGLLQLPNLLLGLATGKVSGGDVGEKVITGIGEEYLNLAKNPAKAFYEKPVSSVLDVLPFLQAGKVAMAGKFSKAGKVATAAKATTPVATDIASILSKASKVSKPQTTMASKMLAENFTVPRKIAARLKPEETAKAILDYKIPAKSVGDYVRVSAQVSGDSGILTNVNRSALKYVPEVNYIEVMPAVKNFISKQATLKGDDLTAIRSFLPKAQGKKIGFANADDLFDSMKQLESQGYQLINSSTDLSPNLRNEQLGKAFLQAADEIEMVLDKGVKTAGVLDQFKTPEVLNTLGKISPKLAQEFQAAKSYSELRGLQQPFVRLQKMAEITENAQSAPFSKLAQAATRGNNLGILNQIPGLNAILSRGGEVIGQRTNIAGARALTSTAPARSALLKTLGLGKTITGKAIKQPATYIAGRQLNTPPGEVTPETTEQVLQEQALPEETPQDSLDTKKIQEVLALAAIQDLSTGGKNIAKIQAISNLIGKMNGKGTKEDAKAKAGKLIVSEVSKVPVSVKNKAGGGLAFKVDAKLNIPKVGKTLIRSKEETELADLEAKYFTLIQTVLTAIQGSRPSDYDVKQYQKALGPSIINSPQVNEVRIKNIQSLLEGIGTDQAQESILGLTDLVNLSSEASQ